MAVPAFSWTLHSRELVDVEIAADGALTILVTAPGTEAPGLYLWKSNTVEPEKICAIASPSFFTFNRAMVIERVRGEHDSIRLFDAHTCKLLSQIDTAGRVIDADARADLIAIALQQDGERTLQLYTLPGKRIATTKIGRNVELGFAPDGIAVLNFDLSDGANDPWRVPTLIRTPSPLRVKSDEVTFIPGSKHVKRYADGVLSIVQWPSGIEKFATPAARTVRVRQLSESGRYGVIHEQRAQGESLTWIDFATGARLHLAEGSIDHATINANSTHVAWVQRAGSLTHQVTIIRSPVNAAATVVPEN